MLADAFAMLAPSQDVRHFVADDLVNVLRRRVDIQEDELLPLGVAHCHCEALAGDRQAERPVLTASDDDFRVRRCVLPGLGQNGINRPLCRLDFPCAELKQQLKDQMLVITKFTEA